MKTPFPCLFACLSVCCVLSVGVTTAPTNNIAVKNLGSARTTGRLNFSKKYKKFGYVDS